MEKKTKIEKITIGVCIGILVFFAFTIAVRFFTRQILTEHFGIDNAFTKFVWFDNNNAAQVDSFKINWEQLYPFEGVECNSETVEVNKQEAENILYQISTRVENTVTSVEEKIEAYTKDYLVFRSKLLEAANLYEQRIGWNYTSFGEYNGVVELSDGYLSGYIQKRDISQQVEALSDLNDFCHNQSIEFLYVLDPYKICEYTDTEISGKLDFSNQNANELLDKLSDSNIDFFDIRKTIHESGINHHDLFYKTDHHWLTTTGLWASQKILEFCNGTYGWNADVSLLDSDQFDYKIYKDWFLGSQGKKVTLSRCQPDDFTLLYPKYETKFHYCVPQEEIDIIDDYSVVYNMTEIETCDYYHNDPYDGCNYGNQPLIQIENLLTADNHKILILHDSFGNCVISCIALAEKNVDSLDIRAFTGSVKKYIEESKPDLVIVMYNAQAVGGSINYSTHKDQYDFR